VKQIIRNRRNYFFVRITFLTAALFMAAFLFQGCDQNKADLKKEDFKTEYQGVLLTGSMVFFGKIKTVAPQFIEMTDIYYIKSSKNIQTEQIENRIVKRGKELHGPETMYITRQNIVMIESVSPDSQIGKAIKDMKEKSSIDIKQ